MKSEISTTTKLSNNANLLLSAVFAFFKQRTCKHEFKGKEMQHRDAEGIVRWQCHKCKKVFAAECGLDILKNGKCIGEWS
jgi:ribosomal protein L37AE/L43A